MNNVEKLIARLVDEHKLTGEGAVILIKAIHQIDQNKSSTIDSFVKMTPINNNLDNCRSPSLQDFILTNNNTSTTY